MDPFTVALAVFGVQKLRGQSTSKSFRDALLAATGAQALSATAVGADMGIKGFSFGADSMLSSLGPASTAQNSLSYGLTQAGGAPLTLAQQFQTTLPGQGISALMGDPYSVSKTGEFTPGTLFGTPETVNKVTGVTTTPGTGYRGLGVAEKVGLGFGTSTLLGNILNKPPKDTSKGFTEQEYKDAYARQPDLNLEKTQQSTYYPATNVYNYQSALYGFNKGGIVNALPRYAVGGVNYLPSKIDHDENDINNYVRASGYVEDGTGSGDKDEDTILAQLADGEFVSRTDAVLGAGIMAGASPKNMKEMRQKGASYFYEQQARFKRIFDLLDASRKLN
jgi:hypothetical protein